MSTETPTPRTDRAVHEYWMGGNWSLKFEDFARRLERERDLAIRRADWMESELKMIAMMYCDTDLDDPDQVQSGLHEGIVYALVEGTIDRLSNARDLAIKDRDEAVQLFTQELNKAVERIKSHGTSPKSRT